MKKHILLFLLLAACWLPQAQAQNYFVSSLATPGAATFSSDKIVNGVISLPFAASTQTIEIETNQQNATVSSDADWCQASFADKTLTLTVTENLSEDARTALLTVRSKDFRPLVITVRQEARLVFAVISDTHVGDNCGIGYKNKIPQALKNLTYRGKLDALAVVGDLTNNGTAAQYTEFVQFFSSEQNIVNPVDNFLFMMGNHDNYDGNGQNNYKNGLKAFNNNRNYPLDQYVLIKGYPFITISDRGSANNDDNVSNGTASYPSTVVNTLKRYLKKAEEEAPGKPIFVFTHVAPRWTCYSTWGELEGVAWAMKVLNPVLNQYPQVVAFCGHSHYPLGDPRSIHQGANPNSSRNNYYTVINTASTNYSEINPGAVDAGIHPEGYTACNEGLILVEQPNGDIEVRRYDTYRDVELDPEHRWVLKAPFDGSMFQYADIRDADDNPNNVLLRTGLPAPVFAEGDHLRLEAYPGDVTVNIPQATDNECVFRYRIRLLKDGKEMKKAFVFSQFYLTTDMPKELSYTFSGLTSNEYTVEVVAYDSYDNQSAPLTGTVTVPADDAPVPEPVGLWTFDNPDDLLAGTGTGVATIQGAYHDNGYVEPFELEELGILPVAGPTEDNGAAFIPKQNSLLMTTNLEAASLKTYTIMADIKLANFNNFMPIFQNDLTNSHDACLFVNKSNGTIGIMRGGLGYSTIALTAGKWHRVVAIAKNAKLTVYLDGRKVVGESPNADTERWQMSTGTLFFADEDGEELDIETAELRFWDKALTPNQVAELGAAVPGEDPGEVVIPDALGVWTFDNADNLLAGTGIATLQGTTHSTTGQGNVTVVGNLADAGILPVEGPAEGNGAINVPFGASLLMTSNLQVNEIGTYSVLWDVKGEDLSTYVPLLQNDLANKKDGSLFFNRNKIGLGGSLNYNGNIENGKWYRVVFVVQPSGGSLYVDGTQLVSNLNLATAYDQHWKLTTGALFFADNDGEEKALETAEIRFWNVALSAAQVNKLGAAGDAAAPEPDPVPEAKGTWTFDNTGNLLEGTGVATLQSTRHSKGSVTPCTPADAGIVAVAGPATGNGAVFVPKNSSLLMTSNLEATTLTTYSILWDVRADNFYPYIPLLQNALDDSKDGSLFTNKNMVGLNAGNLGYHGTLNNGSWYRILFVVENNYATVYLNGEKVGASLSAIPQHWQLTTGALFFADEDGEEEAIETAEIRFWDKALTAAQAQKLGAVPAE